MSAEQVNRDRALAEAFVTLADTLVADYDVIELLHQLTSTASHCSGWTRPGCCCPTSGGPSDGVGLHRPGPPGGAVPAADQRGPCLDCFHSSSRSPGRPARMTDAGPGSPRAPGRPVTAPCTRCPAAALGDHRRAHLFGDDRLSAQDLRIGQALADVATIGILQERAIRRREVLAEQLQVALNSRVIIEQASGILAERGELDIAQAFTLLRSHARSNNQRLSDLARDVVNGRPPSTPCSAPPRPEARRPARSRNTRNDRHDETIKPLVTPTQDLEDAVRLHPFYRRLR